MKRSLLTAIAIVSACTAPVLADEFNGSASIGGSYANIKGEKAKFNEYRALGSGAQGELDLNYRGDSGYYLEGNAEVNVVDSKDVNSSTSNDTNFTIKTGLTDVFKSSIFYKNIPHNFTFGAKTFLNGVGTTNLTATANPTSNADFVNSFNYGLERNNYGAEAEISLKTPFFFLARVDKSDTTGLLPFAIRGNSSVLVEVPAPIDYETTNLYLQTGYRTDRLVATLDGTISNFSNNNERFSTWTPTAAATSTTLTAYLPPSNQYYKIGGSVMYKLPFLNSTFMARGSHSITTSDDFLNEAPTPVSWDGKITYSTASVSLTSNPINKLTTKVFYNYLDKQNKSDTGIVDYGPTGINTQAFSYHKQNAGIDVAYNLPLNTKINAGYDYLHVDRSKTMVGATAIGVASTPETTDHIMSMQLKNSYLDWASFKIGYQHIIRDSSRANNETYASNDLRYYYTSAGFSDRTQDKMKFGIDIEPANGLSIGTEYIYKKSKYDNVLYGFEDDVRHEIYTDISYISGISKLNMYADIELYEANAKYRNIPFGGSYTWPAVDNGTNFSWTTNRKDINYALGVKGEIEIIKNKLSAGIGYRYEQTNGTNDFITSSTPTTVPTNVDYLDNYIKQGVNVKTNYSFDKNIGIEVGYVHEHLKYSDDAYAGYQYYATTTNYLSGAYANPNYDASLFYTKLNFKF